MPGGHPAIPRVHPRGQLVRDLRFGARVAQQSLEGGLGGQGGHFIDPVWSKLGPAVS